MLSHLPVPAPVRATAILNLGSGSQRQQEVAETLAEIFAQQGADLRIGYASRINDVYFFARDAVAERRPIVLAGGGDGTISAVASVLAGTDTALGVLPLGTFNYFARDLGVPLDLEGAARLCFEGTVRAVALAEVNGRVFLNNASLGIYPTMLREREETYRRWGGRSQLAAYIAGFLGLFRTHRYLRLEMSTGNKIRNFRTPLMFAAHNLHQVEAFGITGADCVREDSLAFYIVPPVGRAGLLRLAWLMFRGRLDVGADLQFVCSSEARVETRRPVVNVAYDGEVERMRSPLHFRVRQSALKVVAPAEPIAS